MNVTLSPTRHIILTALHIATLLAAIMLIVLIAHNTLHNLSLTGSPEFLRAQTVICMVFLADAILTIVFYHRATVADIVFVLIALPYTPIIHALGLGHSVYLTYILQLLPMLRAAYVLAMATNSLYPNRANGLLVAYLTLLGTMLFFASMTFWVEEHAINTSLHSYWDALWWAAMNATTTGCSITATSPVGRAMTVALPAMGMILFPVFTIYITNAGRNQHSDTQD